jgi:hypothetical protein
MGPTRSVRMDNYFTLLYTETQETNHSNDNANQPPPTHGDTRDADLAAAEAAATSIADGMDPKPQLRMRQII